MHLLSFEGRSFYYEWLTEQRETNCRGPPFSGLRCFTRVALKLFCKLLINLFLAEYPEVQLIFQLHGAILRKRVGPYERASETWHPLHKTVAMYSDTIILGRLLFLI